MIPVLGVPVLNRPDLLARMLASVDAPVGRLVVIDNGGVVPEIPGAHVVRLPGNLGVAASWNLLLKATLDAPWWAIVNSDVAFGPGDLASLAAAMADPCPRIATLDGFAAFALNAAALDRIGFFDEAFHPAYCEDADYEYRARLAEVPIVSIPSRLRHDRSSTIAEPRLAVENGRTYPQNAAYYAAKWGGPLRGGETYATPFDEGSDPRFTRLEPARLRRLRWSTAAVRPAGYETR